MNSRSAIMQRYLQDDVPTQMGGIAANLARVGSFSHNFKNREVVFGLLDESKYFVEWCAPNAEIDQAARLVELQIQLALWQFDWDTLWLDLEARQQVAEASLRWSNEVLSLSGLLDGCRRVKLDGKRKRDESKTRPLCPHSRGSE